ncbi:site-specific integrase [Halomonas piscis]|uniref:Site-specific integrase n=1 Tax=Halomonas piscis TaxID=3031727 RepID=A0ABY9YW73_9GAMM|nr:site-specific integrase [Halomonas piscis]WNK19081.1 site-specific integrase [Halomonas piscis]
MGNSSKTPAYLIRSRHGIWYFRIVVPTYAQQRIGKKVIKRSLRTRSKREAILKASSLLIEASELIGRALPDAQLNGSSPLASLPESHLASSQNIVIPHAPAKRLSEVLEGYRQQQRLEGVSLKTLDDKQAVVDLLIRIVGDLPITDYTIETVKQFRDTVLQLPPLATRTLTQKPHLTLDMLIETADKTISITTYNNYVKNLVTVFEHAVAMELITRNPFSGMKIKLKRKVNSYRDEFTEEEIGRIFFEVKQQEGWKYWIPHLGYYGAFRLNEICQLYKEDVKIIDGIACIHVRERKPDQRLKNHSAERVIPIHHDLLKMGFVEYVSSLPDQSRVFNLRWSEKHGYSATPSKWFGRLRDKLGIEQRGRGKKDFHSFRHTIANELKQKGVSENQIGGVLGHTTGGITNTRYGKEYEPDVLKSAIGLIRSID